MNVLHVTQNYYPSRGGTQYVMQKISECLHEKYNDAVTIVTTNSLYGPGNSKFKKIVEKESLINGVHVKRYNYIRAHKPLVKLFSKAKARIYKSDKPSSLSLLSIGPLSMSMRNAINKSTADVICASSIHYTFADYGLYRHTTGNPKPFVLYGALHLETSHVPKRYIQRAKAADCYIANTQYEKDFLLSYNIESNKIIVAGAGTDILDKTEINSDEKLLRERFNINPGKRVILCISRHEAFKGLPVLLNAFKKLGTINKDVCLIIAGSAGSFTGQLEFAKEDITDLFVYTSIDDRTKAALIQIANIVVLPSKEESFGVVFLEAWSFKKPVIGARIGAVASLISEGKDGLLFIPDDVDDLTEKMSSLLDSHNTCINLGEAGFTKVQQYYNWNHITKVFRDAYIKAIESFNRQYV
jgi:glycosyltransferase involved in cell wall biosynthesis